MLYTYAELKCTDLSVKAVDDVMRRRPAERHLFRAGPARAWR